MDAIYNRNGELGGSIAVKKDFTQQSHRQDSLNQPIQPDQLAQLAFGQEQQSVPDRLLLTQARGKQVAQLLDVSQLEVELERAIWQVEKSLNKTTESQEDQDSSQDEKSKKS